VVDVVVWAEVAGVVSVGAAEVVVVCADDDGVVLCGVDVVCPLGVEDDGAALLEPLLAFVLVLVLAGGFACSPLLLSSVWICCWTDDTTAATAAGVPPAPRVGRAFSCFRSFSSVVRSCWVGSALSVTTI
jgi:hypothetical protein